MNRKNVYSVILVIISGLVIASSAVSQELILPDSGQSLCYDWERIICDEWHMDGFNQVCDSDPYCPEEGEDFYGQDATYSINMPDLINNNDGTIKDKITGLIWEQKSETNETQLFTEEEALSYCENLDLGGKEDWRTPTRPEYSTLLNYNFTSPALDPALFPYYTAGSPPNVLYWTTSGYHDNASIRWRVSLPFGQIVSYTTTLYPQSKVRCVSGSTLPVSSFVDNGNGIVTDSTTGLMWEQKTDDGSTRDKDITRTWNDSLKYCEDLTLGEYTDWRLPTAREQERIVDLGKSNPAVDTQFFPNTQSDIYWSGTSCAGCHKFKALSIDYSDGEMYFGVKYRDGVYGENYERCVRGGQCIDSDEDTVCDNFDNCPNAVNLNQEDADSDSTGDACDSDTIYGTINCNIQATVAIYKNNCASDVFIAETTTDQNGYYSFGNLESGQLLIVPTASDYRFIPLRGWPVIPQTVVQPYDFTADRYPAAGVLDDQIIEQAQIMTTHIEGTGIEVRATEVNWLEFGGSYVGINAAENWVQPYFNFSPEDMSAYMNAPPEINGIINTKMKSKDGIEDNFGIILDGEQGTCADVQDEIYAATFSLLSPDEQAKYSAEGQPLLFIRDDNPGNEPDSNPVLQSSGWLPVDPATMLTEWWGVLWYEPLGLYVAYDNPLAGDDERYKGVRYCKLLSHQAILSWFLSKSFEDDPVLITPSALECTDPRSRTESYPNGSCLFWFSQGNSYYCSDYIGPDFTPESAEVKCASRGTEATPSVYSSDTCSTRDGTGEIQAIMPENDYAGHGALCDVHCMEGNEFIWNAYTEVDPSNPENVTDVCGGFPIFYP